MSKQNELREILGIAIGEASMCWHSTPHGVFDSEYASEIVDKTEKQIIDLFREKARKTAHDAVSELTKQTLKQRAAVYVFGYVDCNEKTHKNIDKSFDEWGK